MKTIIQWHSSLIALVVFLFLIIFSGNIIFWAEDNKISLSGLYAAIFDWSAIQTGFLFAVYGFIAGKKDGFVEAIANTPAMSFFNSSLKKAIIVGFLLTIISMPLIVVPLSVDGFNIWYFLLCAWFCLFIWAFLLFCRVAYTFGVIVQVPDNADIPAG